MLCPLLKPSLLHMTWELLEKDENLICFEKLQLYLKLRFVFCWLLEHDGHVVSRKPGVKFMNPCIAQDGREGGSL